jgi:hypothetical protein
MNPSQSKPDRCNCPPESFIRNANCPEHGVTSEDLRLAREFLVAKGLVKTDEEQQP